MTQKRVLSLFIILALAFIPIIVFILSRLTPEKKIKVNPIEDVVQAIEKIGVNPLEKIAKESLLASDEEYGVFIKNLKSNEKYYYNENEKFDSASLYKLWVMAIAFQEIKDGQLSENEKLSGNLEVLDEILLIATPSSNPTPQELSSEEQKEVREISYVASDAIEKMITASDNYAALLVASRSGNFAVTNFLKTYDFPGSSFRSPPSTTAKDIGLFFEKLYKGELVDREYSKKMLDILEKQALNDRIPKYLPEKIEVAHKTGEFEQFKHDSGIVFSGKGDYIIVVLSKTKNPYQAAEKIAKFSKEVYGYFLKKTLP